MPRSSRGIVPSRALIDRVVAISDESSDDMWHVLNHWYLKSVGLLQTTCPHDAKANSDGSEKACALTGVAI